MTKRISIINFKGGVGKTTLAFQISTKLSTIRDKHVLLCDVDHQSSLSITCLGGKEWDKIVASKLTIDEIFKHMTEPDSPLPGREIIHHPTGKLRTRYPNIDILPSALSLDETEIELTGSAQGNAVKSEWRKKTLICEWLEKNQIDSDYDYIIFDCPPATKIVTQNALAASHGYIVPTVSDAVSVRGTPHLTHQMLGKIEGQFSTLSGFLKTKDRPIVSTFIPKRQLVGIVMNRMKHASSYSGYTNDITENLAGLKRIYTGHEIVEPYIPDGVGLSESLTARLPVYEFPKRQNIGGKHFPEIFSDLTTELKRRIDAL
jgi:chromosome partitioning protein